MKCKCDIEWTLVSDNKYVATNTRSMPSKFCHDCGQELATIQPEYEPGMYVVEKNPSRCAALYTEAGDWHVIHESEMTSQPLFETVTEAVADGRYQIIRQINLYE